MIKRFPKLLIFPLILLVIVCGLSFFEIHGSSIGIYNQIFFGENIKDPNLIVGKPRSIRSDEWLVETPMTLSQSKVDFNQENKLIGLGENMAVLSDNPVSHWSSFFKPQNWSFFFLPLAKAFAFKWWFRGFILIIGTYFFLSKLTKKNYLLSIGASLVMFFTPFIQWWYATIALESIGFLFLALYCATNLIEYKNKSGLIINSLALTYFSLSFVLLLYLPFLIPLILLGVFYFVGYLLNERVKLTKKRLLNILISFVFVLVSAGTILFNFYSSFKDIISIVSNTSYPGKREIVGGTYSLLQFFGGFFNFLLLKTRSFPLFIGNQSEGSNTFLLVPFLAPIILFYSLRNFFLKRNLDFVLLSLFAYSIFISLWVLIGFPHIVGKIFFLDLVPLNRLIIGLVVANLITVVYFLSKFREPITLDYKILSYLISGSVLILYLYIGFFVRLNFPEYKESIRSIAFATFSAFILTLLLLLRKQKLFIFSLLLFAIFSAGLVNPLYRGLDAVLNTPLSTSLKSVQSQNSDHYRWVVYDNSIVTNYLIANGINSLNSVHLYPQSPLWAEFDKNHTYYSTWNRFAHVVFSGDEDVKIEFVLNQPDVFTVKVNPCNQVFSKLNVKYFIFPYSNNLACLKEVAVVKTTTPNYYIYKSN